MSNQKLISFVYKIVKLSFGGTCLWSAFYNVGEMNDPFWK